jgi:hypothetical protein
VKRGPNITCAHATLLYLSQQTLSLSLPFPIKTLFLSLVAALSLALASLSWIVIVSKLTPTDMQERPAMPRLGHTVRIQHTAAGGGGGGG